MKRLSWELTAWQPSIYEAARPAVLVQRQLHQGLRTDSFALDLCGLIGKRQVSTSIVQEDVRNKFKEHLQRQIGGFYSQVSELRAEQFEENV